MKTVTMYKTIDCRIFDNEQEAMEHESKLNANCAMINLIRDFDISDHHSINVNELVKHTIYGVFGANLYKILDRIHGKSVQK